MRNSLEMLKQEANSRRLTASGDAREYLNYFPQFFRRLLASGYYYITLLLYH
ncbi:MAG: hypothetical protein GX594_16380 [Pirellulaceae bacterium]|nr:hypothetical protein [Pirellulaceae bacterium]